jgi:hypothetical protein
VVTLAGCSTSGAPGQGATSIPKIPETAQAPIVPRVEPARIDIDKINAHSSLVPTGLKPDGSLDAVDVKQPEQASYYCIKDPAKICSSGVLPGQIGPAVVLGHIDGNKKKGIFHDLGQLAIGDKAVVTLKDGTILTFQAYKILQTAKAQFPTQIVYQPTTVPEIRLATCTGPFVGGSLGYNDNLIVFMSLVPNPPGE